MKCTKGKATFGIWIFAQMLVAATFLAVLLVIFQGRTYESDWFFDKDESNNWDKFRLPNHIKPTLYNLRFKPDLKTKIFAGEVTIKIEVKASTSYIALHKADDMEIEHQAITGTADSDPSILKVHFYNETELYVMQLTNEIPEGSYYLYFRFKRRIKSQPLRGVYEGSYTDPITKIKKLLATTKFQPTHARSAFPCFDEPGMKAVFRVTLEHQSEYPTALFNMPVKATMKHEDGWIETTFEETPTMSTYILCFIVSDYSFSATNFTSQQKVKPLRVYAPPHLMNQTHFALSTSKELMKFFEDYLKVDYPLPKQDMIALYQVPSAAMENWGLITFRINALLCNANSNLPTKKEIAMTMAHEISHSWFGNMVTPSWWEDLFLCEGFARFMEFKAIDSKFPEWLPWQEFVTKNLQKMIISDTGHILKPVIRSVGSTAEARSLFGPIVYSKGASILRMAENFLGEETFRKGLTNYLNKYAYKSVSTDDLWAELESVRIRKANETDLASIMDTWLKQGGVPCVTVNRSKTDPSVFTVQQKIFHSDPKLKVNETISPFKYVWKIPLSYITSSGVRNIVWLNDKKMTITIPEAKESTSWVKFNVNQNGYYIVSYDEETWKRFTANLNKMKLSDIDRANLLFDSALLSETHVTSYKSFFEMTSTLNKERAPALWLTAFNIFEHLMELHRGTDVGFAIETHIRYITVVPHKKMPRTKDLNNTDRLLQPIINELACLGHSEHCDLTALDHSKDSTLKPAPKISRGRDWLKDNKKSLGNYLLKKYPMPWMKKRLPKSVVPIHYDLTLQPNLTSDYFSGHATIFVQVSKETRFIVVHGKRLNFTKITVTNHETHDVVPTFDSFFNEENDFVVTPLKTSAKSNVAYELHYEFTGLFDKTMRGLYKSTYNHLNADGSVETRFISTTHFEPLGARRAFPCFDEPSFKATFNVTLIHEKVFTALSNMPIKNTYVRNDQLTVTNFDKSVKMSTYLVCMIVCDFEHMGGQTKRGVRVTIYAPPNKAGQAKYALEVATRIIEYYEGYFKINYPLPKLDMIAIPDFRAGAMENWGLVTYRETMLLYDEGVTPTTMKKNIAGVIAHEIAHMWFGNLVTMKWWDNLWLNEGFAAYIETKGQDNINATWEMDAQFFFDKAEQVLKRDATLGSHPIVAKLNDSNDIADLFDSITYKKGASVLRMLENFMGSTAFREGISDYLKTYSFSNAETADLWRHLQKAYGKVAQSESDTISNIMDTWTRQMGYPCIDIRRKTNSVFVATQNRFLLHPDSHNIKSNFTWNIPLSYRVSKTGKSSPPIIWMNKKTLEFEVKNIGEANWVKFNADNKGYYVVNYNKDWDTLTKLLTNTHEILKPSDRANLIHDAFLLALAGHVSYDQCFGLTEYLKNENSFISWMSAQHAFNNLYYLLESTSAQVPLEMYMDEISNPVLKTIKFEETGHYPITKLRAILVSFSCRSKNKECQKFAANQFSLWLNGKSISLNLKTSIYCYGMREIGNGSIWETTWKKYKTETSSQEKNTLLQGLACTKDKTLLKRYIDLAWDESNVRSQDYFTALSSIASNPIGLPLAWDYFKANWTKFRDRFESLTRTVNTICEKLKTEAQLTEMKRLIKEHDLGLDNETKTSMIANVEVKIKWVKNYKNQIESWLKKRQEPNKKERSVRDSEPQLNDDSEACGENAKDSIDTLKGSTNNQDEKSQQETENSNAKSKPWKNTRLPKYVVPIHYDLTIQPDLSTDNFYGHVTIVVRVLKDTSVFVVHADGVDITKTTVTSRETGKILHLKSTFLNSENEYAVTTLKTVAKGDRVYELHFKFQGVYSENLKGLFKSTYVGSNGRRSLALTHFEGTYARRAFPCFDEPSFKATFNITLAHSTKHIALSNMPVKFKYKRNEKLVETTFETTPVMSVYTVCMIVCDYEHVSRETKRGVKINAYAPPEKVAQMQYGVGVAVKALEYYEQYFKIPYILPKLDLVAVPEFSIGAMENWGLVPFKESAILYDEQEMPTIGKVHVAGLVAHELAHMWFGNLVTMKWWSEVFLNEGFAQYFQSKAQQSINENWEMDAQHFVMHTESVMLKDAKSGCRPVVSSLKYPSDIDAFFDEFTYDKGASVVRMLESFMGSAAFREGVNNYLNTYKFQNADTTDLWKILQSSYERVAKPQSDTINNIMETWVRQRGFPCIDLKRKDSGFVVTQSRFVLDRDLDGEKHSPFRYTWKIPLTYRTRKNHDKNPSVVWINDRTQEIDLEDIGNSDWVKFNVESKGYYVVNYNKDWDKMAELLEQSHKLLQPTDRANLIHNAFLLARGGLVNYKQSLGLTTYLKKEHHFVPWESARRALFYIHELLEDTPAQDQLEAYMDQLSKQMMKKVSWDNIGNYQIKRLRKILIDFSCRSGNRDCRKFAAEKFSRFLDGKPISPDLRNEIYRYGMREIGNKDVWGKAWRKYTAASNWREKKNLLMALACVKDVPLLKRYMELINDEDRIRLHSRNYYAAFQAMLSNSVGLQVAWDYFKMNWKTVKERLHKTVYEVNAFAEHFKTEEQHKELKRFLEGNDVGIGSKKKKFILRKVELRAKWLKTNTNEIKDWLTTQLRAIGRSWSYDVGFDEYIPWESANFSRIEPGDYNFELQPELNARNPEK